MMFKSSTSTTHTCHHHTFLGLALGLGLATMDLHRSPNVLESATLKPPSTEKRVIGSILCGLASCTESLAVESSDEIHNSHDCSEEKENCDDEIWRRQMMKVEGRGKVRSFPPPLPSLNRNGKPSFYLRPVRKDGRLELTEVRIQPSEILHASRHNGRLTLHLVPDQEEEEIEKKEEEEERFREWKFCGVGGSEALRRCHEMVNQHHHVHRNLGMCGISIV